MVIFFLKKTVYIDWCTNHDGTDTKEGRDIGARAFNLSTYARKEAI